MATVEIIPIPIGSQYVQSIGANDPDVLNDFPVLLVFSENATGLTESDITLSSGSSLVSLEGKNSVRKAVVRPQTTAGMVTITIAQNAVAEGNPETSKSIRVSTSFPDTDAEVPTELFTVSGSRPNGITVSPTRILTVDNQTTKHVRFFTYAGVEQTSEELNISVGSLTTFGIDYINRGFILALSGNGSRRYDLDRESSHKLCDNPYESSAYRIRYFAR